jgi:hypothetical protein
MQHDPLDDEPLHRSMLAVNIEGSGRPERNHYTRVRLRDALYRIVRGGLRHIAISPASAPPGQISNLPRRNANFTGRDRLLDTLRRALASGRDRGGGQPPRGAGGGTGRRSGVLALHGMAGVGKSQLAREYAYRCRGEYDLVWWIRAESRPAILAGLAGLAQRLGVPSQGDHERLVDQLVAELGKRERWLAVFDNVSEPHDLDCFLRWRGHGHVLITSRDAIADPVATRVRVDVPSVAEATRFLLDRTGCDDAAAAARLAEVLGRRPLALEQAAAFLSHTGLSPDRYLHIYQQRRSELLRQGGDNAHLTPLEAVIQVTFNKVADQAPAAAQLATLCAFLAPSTIPHDLVTTRPDLLPSPLGEAVRDQRRYVQTVAALCSYSLAEQDHQGLHVHQLLQQAIRDNLPEPERKSWAERALKLLEVAWPTDPPDRVTWPRYWQLLSHTLVATAMASRLQFAPETSTRVLRRAGIPPVQRAEWRPADRFDSPRLAESFPDGQLLVDLHGGSATWHEPSDALEALHQLLRALGVEEQELPATVMLAAARYRRLLRGRRVLVVLDHADNAAQVRPLLPGNATCGVLVRGPLGLVALDNGSHLAADALELAEAVALLGQTVGRQRTAAEPDAAAVVAQTGDCLPLALRILGSYLTARPHLRLGELAERLVGEQRRQAALELGDLGARASFALAYQELSPAAAWLFRRLSLLPVPRFGGREAAAVAGDPSAAPLAGGLDAAVVARALDELVDAGLLERLDGERYRLDGLLRLLGCERFAEEPAEQRRAALRDLRAWLRSRPETSPAGAPTMTVAPSPVRASQSERAPARAVVRVAGIRRWE